VRTQKARGQLYLSVIFFLTGGGQRYRATPRATGRRQGPSQNRLGSNLSSTQLFFFGRDDQSEEFTRIDQSEEFTQNGGQTIVVSRILRGLSE
jgi:hypothetical protein